ncbi:cryptochrome DASH [Vibrio inusitatus NBRC 102082]|uniref:Cryptochrome DASH n=1 Tax=Vibrio inusitatus NBRC 102082 TaxID=1219070 RepID=A0A4Y3HTJ5_9VIBR|nr:DASH family cryptochrome [Vibrio inusitatus]GEA50072.1 cryptochrome DASH [Vibrio inusitatus NBRC 102082]
MSDKKRGLIWFGNDCRVSDNNLLIRANYEVDELICVYLPYYKLTTLKDEPPSYSKSEHLISFEQQSLCDLATSLTPYGHKLYVPKNLNHLYQILDVFQVDTLYRAFHPGLYEQDAESAIAQAFPNLYICRAYTGSLFHQSQLPFTSNNLPATFTQFRKHIEMLTIVKPLEKPETLPKSVVLDCSFVEASNAMCSDESFIGGESAGHQHLFQYFSSQLPHSYKQVRNQLDGWENSTKLSPWLASGNLSARQIWHSINQFEQEFGSNESTYWIKFELLWREFFHWYSAWHQEKLFQSGGIKKAPQLWDDDAETLEAWINGETGFDIVDACMRQLKNTGFMSNRGRQLVASCLIHDLGLDWRLGALYFEHNLIDYDVGSNWGNWQYIAGVGADAKPVRRFDLDKQTQIYDPSRVFINRWLDKGWQKCG